MKLIRLIAIGFLLGIASGSDSHAAEGEIKLIGAEEGIRNRGRLPAEIVGDVVIVGRHNVDHDRHPGAGRIYTLNRNKWELTAELTAHDRKPNTGQAGFGYDVSISAPPGRRHADYAIIGAPGDDEGAENAGAAYIYAFNSPHWQQEVKLTAADAGQRDAFGHVVSIDGTTAVVGAPGDDDAGNNSGAVYLFVRDANGWKQHAKLVPKDSAKLDAFGDAVKIQADTLIVGATGHTHGGTRFAGAVFVFVRDGDTWREQAKLTADDAGAGDQFGVSVGMEGDTIIVGSKKNDPDGIRDAGAAYIFQRDGNTWNQAAKLTAPKKRKGDHFGSGVATSRNIAIVGAPLSEAGGFSAGAAYSFVNADGVWKNTATVLPEVAHPNLFYGSAIAISGDTVIVTGCDGPEKGVGVGNGIVAYVYSGAEHFNTPPFAVEPFGLKITTLAHLKRTALYQNFPNPFNPETWLPYRLAGDAPVTFRIHNIHGQLVRALDLGTQEAGDYRDRETAAYWDGRDITGEMVSSGVYFYTLRAGAFQATRRMLILK
ncbi:MAG: hypothetical protein OXN17_06975 [Candidatus Poribacteria bacterium]|nr:hypothetical protein [Candidatus Poribacteria bacterium]